MSLDGTYLTSVLRRMSAWRQKRSSGLPSYFINSISIGRGVPLGTVLHMKFHLDIKNCRGAARRRARLAWHRVHLWQR